MTLVSEKGRPCQRISYQQQMRTIILKKSYARRCLMRFSEKTVYILLILCTCSIAPALAGTEYMSGSPQLSASVAGTNEFGPGNEVQLTITIQNTGLNEFKFVQRGIIDRQDLPNTAKSVTVGLNAGNAPVVIKSDPQMLGDIIGTGSANAVFTTKINSDAAAGRYTLPLFVNYTYLYQAEQFGSDTIQYTYKQVNETIGIPITIQSDISIKVQSATPEHLNVGSEGYLSMKINEYRFRRRFKSDCKNSAEWQQSHNADRQQCLYRGFPFGEHR